MVDALKGYYLHQSLPTAPGFLRVAALQRNGPAVGAATAQYNEPALFGSMVDLAPRVPVPTGLLSG